MANRKPLEESETTMTRKPSHLERAAELLRSILDPVDGQAAPRATPEQKAWLEADRAMASRLVELESALEFLDNHGAFAKLTKPNVVTFALRPTAVLVVAADIGWTSPTQKPNDGGRND